MSDVERPELDFSQRMGLAPITKPFQLNSMSDQLRIGLWNMMTVSFWEEYQRPYDGERTVRYSNFEGFAKVLYALYYGKPIDELPRRWDDLLVIIRKDFFFSEWHRAYAFVEYMAQRGPESDSHSHNRRKTFISNCNSMLGRENSAFRFVSGKLAPITSQEEIDEIETAIAVSGPYSGVKKHLQTALVFLTDRETPDYRNSIKESISAVESLARHLTGDSKATLGAALTALEKKHHLEPTIKAAFSKLYGYTNDADGIRHSLMNEASKLTKADARFMLICCSAFINFAIDSVEE